MKREQKPFVVEVKRGKRRFPFAGRLEDQNGKASDANRRAEIALFAASPGGPTAPDLSRSEKIGRILPSLIEVPSFDPLREEPAPRRRGRKPGSKNKPKFLASGGAPVFGTAPKGGREGGAVANGAGLSGAVQRSALDPYAGAVEAGTQHAEAPGSGHSEAATAQTRRVRLRDRSAILARYVFKTEPAPGERWKRPSRRRADRQRKYKISI